METNMICKYPDRDNPELDSGLVKRVVSQKPDLFYRKGRKGFSQRTQRHVLNKVKYLKIETFILCALCG
jgi:hypothetical protein